VPVVESLVRTDELIIAKQAPDLSFLVPVRRLVGMQRGILGDRPGEFTPPVTARNTMDGMRAVPSADLAAGGGDFVRGGTAPAVGDVGARIMATLPRSSPALKMKLSIGLS
jgi:hypothetical protein